MSASLCSHCRAPLPAATGLVTCSFCGTANTVQPPIGSTQIRAAVRQVLAEERAPASAPSSPSSAKPALMVALVAGVVLTLGLAGVLVSLLTRAPVVPPVVRPPKAVVPPRPPPPPPKPLEAPTPAGLGSPSALALGEGQTLFAVVGQELIRVELQTLRPAWRAPVVGSEGTILQLGDRVVFAGETGAFFFDAATGAPTGKYLFKTGGFKVSACAAGPRQVLVQTVFDGVLRFDVGTAGPVKGTTSCHRNADLHCDAGQRCGFSSSRVGDMSCRYGLRVGDAQVTFCEVDGTKELVLVSHTGARVNWKTPRGKGSSTNPDYASVVDGVLVTADGASLEGFDPATGERRWSREQSGNPRAVISDGRRLFVGHEGTVLLLDAKTGDEVARVLGQ